MKPECSAIKEKMLIILPISLFMTKFKKKKKKKDKINKFKQC